MYVTAVCLLNVVIGVDLHRPTPTPHDIEVTCGTRMHSPFPNTARSGRTDMSSRGETTVREGNGTGRAKLVAAGRDKGERLVKRGKAGEK